MLPDIITVEPTVPFVNTRLKMPRIDRNGNLILFIIITQRLIKLSESDPVAMRHSLLTRIGIPIITVQFIIRVVVIEGGIYIQDIRIC